MLLSHVITKGNELIKELKKEREENVILKQKFDEVSKENEEIQDRLETFMTEEKKSTYLIIEEFKQTNAYRNELIEYSLESFTDGIATCRDKIKEKYPDLDIGFIDDEFFKNLEEED